MARKPTPWWWDNEQGWYVNHLGKRHFLGKHPDGAAKPKKSPKTGRWNAPDSIDEAFRNLIGDDQPVPATSDTVIEILDDFITWAQENKAPLTAAGYKKYCDDFVKAADGVQFGTLPVQHLTSKHVTSWLNQRPTWGPTTKKNAITAILAGLNWAVTNRGLPANPIQRMKKPEAKRRTVVIPPADFEELLKKVPARFKELLTVTYDSGARPFEMKELEARHCRLEKQMAVIPAEEAKGRRHPRVFYFPTKRSLRIVTHLCKEHPTGSLFRNNRGNKWTGNAVKCAFARAELETGKRYCHYMLRHSFVTHKLVAGVDSHVVAKLAGHSNTAMIDSVYSHVADDYAYMLQQAKKTL